MKKILAMTLAAAISAPVLAHDSDQSTMIDGLDFGPLAQLVGTWISTEQGGIDVAPAQKGATSEAGTNAITPFYETMTFEVAADAVNASAQHLVALYYKQEVFRKADDSKFHDQRGYFVYDKENGMVYNSFCVPRNTCITAEGPAGKNLYLVAPESGIAESRFMADNASTTGFTMNMYVDGDSMTYSQTIMLDIYGKEVAHTDASQLRKVK